MKSYEQLSSHIASAESVLIIQADNPDGDSLASALALEAVLLDLGKKPILYCGVEIPAYLRYMEGWDRVNRDLPTAFDMSIIVDTSALILLETLQKNRQIDWVKSKPCVIIDHHATEPTIDFASLTINEVGVSTGIVIFNIAESLGWEIKADTARLIAMSILSDSLGLTSQAVDATTLLKLSRLVELGANLSEIDQARKALQKKSKRILAFKGQLLQRIAYDKTGKLAHLTISWEETEKYSHEYNPPMLVLDEMRMVEGVQVAIAYKTYPDGRITGKIRANPAGAIADKIAENFGGGGHPYAAGFKVTDGRSLDEIKNAVEKLAISLLETNEQ